MEHFCRLAHWPDPLAGDIFDVGFKANSKNVHIIKSHVANHQKEDGLDVEPDRSVHH